MDATNQPLVSVPVVTYNSALFILETLESIKAQTYQNIELIISDDCSTDNTIELCQKWIEENKKRFIRTQIITVAENTGVSANLNRAEAACQGEWIKGIAGDDLLLPDCIENCINHILENPDVVYLFGKIEAFGASEERNEYFAKKVFDYSFFDLDINEQLERLVFGENCVPASTCFYNRKKAIEYNVTNDERIPLLEDWPKWINILELGIHLDFMDEILVRYRIHENSLSTFKFSVFFYRSTFLFDLLYRYPRRYVKDQDSAIEFLTSRHIEVVDYYYREAAKLQSEINGLRHSYEYRIGKIILKPFKFIRSLFKNIQ